MLGRAVVFHEGRPSQPCPLLGRCKGVADVTQLIDQPQLQRPNPRDHPAIGDRIHQSRIKLCSVLHYDLSERGVEFIDDSLQQFAMFGRHGLQG